MRDRLIELLFKANHIVKRNGFEFNANVIADYLLENGVIVPPCKVGDYIEWDGGLSKRLHQIIAFYYEPEYGLRFDLGHITPIVSHEAIIRIVPKEEAEQALGKLQASYEQVKGGTE